MDIKKYILRNDSVARLSVIAVAAGGAVFIWQLLLDLVFNVSYSLPLMICGLLLLLAFVPIWKISRLNASYAKGMHNANSNIATLRYGFYEDTKAYADSPGIVVIGQRALIHGDMIYFYSGKAGLRDIKLVNEASRKILFFFDGGASGPIELSVPVPDDLRDSADEMYAKVRMKIVT